MSRLPKLAPAEPEQTSPADRSPRRPKTPSVPLRIVQLERVFSRQHGPILRNDDKGRFDLSILTAHIANLANGISERMDAAFERWAPWMSSDEREECRRAALAAPRTWTADELGRDLGLTFADRTAWRITTIGACDVDKQGRRELQKQKHRDRAKERRRRERERPKPPPSAWARGIAVLEVLPGNAETPVNQICKKLAGSSAFVGCSVREAVHRTIRALEAGGKVKTRHGEARAGKMPPLWVRRANERDLRADVAKANGEGQHALPTSPGEYRNYLERELARFDAANGDGVARWYYSISERELRVRCGIGAAPDDDEFMRLARARRDELVGRPKGGRTRAPGAEE